jgi:pyrroloquinoline quinone (PQQ) biosynthesis protein C
MRADAVLKKLDQVVDDFVNHTRFYNEPMTRGHAVMFVKQHRLNTRQRNSVLKLRVATNCTDWDTKISIIKACAQEIIADNEFAGGKPHWQVIEDMGVALGLPREEIRAEKPLTSTEIAWAAWEGLMSNKPWLEGIVANTCAERVNVPGYGKGDQRAHGWSWVQRHAWKKSFGLKDHELEFWSVHEEADVEHSNLGWQSVARFAEHEHMEDAVVHACEINLKVWNMYLDGIAAAGDKIS